MPEARQNISDNSLHYLQNRVTNEESSDKQQKSSGWNLSLHELLLGQPTVPDFADEKVHRALK